MRAYGPLPWPGLKMRASSAGPQNEGLFSRTSLAGPQNEGLFLGPQNEGPLGRASKWASSKCQGLFLRASLAGPRNEGLFSRASLGLNLRRASSGGPPFAVSAVTLFPTTVLLSLSSQARLWSTIMKIHKVNVRIEFERAAAERLQAYDGLKRTANETNETNRRRTKRNSANTEDLQRGDIWTDASRTRRDSGKLIVSYLFVARVRCGERGPLLTCMARRRWFRGGNGGEKRGDGGETAGRRRDGIGSDHWASAPADCSCSPNSSTLHGNIGSEQNVTGWSLTTRLFYSEATKMVKEMGQKEQDFVK